MISDPYNMRGLQLALTRCWIQKGILHNSVSQWTPKIRCWPKAIRGFDKSVAIKPSKLTKILTFRMGEGSCVYTRVQFLFSVPLDAATTKCWMWKCGEIRVSCPSGVTGCTDRADCFTLSELIGERVWWWDSIGIPQISKFGQISGCSPHRAMDRWVWNSTRKSWP